MIDRDALGLILAAPVLGAVIPASRIVLETAGAGLALLPIAAALTLAIAAATPGVRLLACSVASSMHGRLAMPATTLGSVIAMAAATSVIASHAPASSVVVVPGGWAATFTNTEKEQLR